MTPLAAGVRQAALKLRRRQADGEASAHPEVSMSLHGTLDTFPLPDVVRLLAATGKHGRLDVEGDGGAGAVWLAGGRVVVPAGDAPAPPVEVVAALLRLPSGSFTFVPGEVEAAEEHDPEAVLAEAESLRDEWDELWALAPAGAEVRLVAQLPTEQVTVTADRWRLLAALPGTTRVDEVAETSGLGPLGVRRAVRALVQDGLAEVVEPDPTGEPASPDGDEEGRPDPGWGSHPAWDEVVPDAAAVPAPSLADDWGSWDEAHAGEAGAAWAPGHGDAVGDGEASEAWAPFPAEAPGDVAAAPRAVDPAPLVEPAGDDPQPWAPFEPAEEAAWQAFEQATSDDASHDALVDPDRRTGADEPSMERRRVMRFFSSARTTS